jgi:ATP-binding cassette ChvD family protein
MRSHLQSSRPGPQQIARHYAKDKKKDAVIGVKQGLNVLANDKRKNVTNKGYGIPGKFVFAMREVSKHLDDGRPILEDLNLQFYLGAKIGVLGMNGAGKSTLLRIIAGEDQDFDGEAKTLGNYKIGFLQQEPDLDEELNVRDNVLQGVKDKKLLVDEWRKVEALAQGRPENELDPKLRQQYQKLKKQIDEGNLLDLERRIEVAMDALNCPSGDLPVTGLSGGERRRVALCRLLISNPDLLLLDEPTNHLDADSVAWLERYLSEYKGTVLAVTHDRYFLESVAGWILEIDRGRALPFQGNYSAWLQNKQERLEQEKNREVQRVRRLAEEREWIAQSPRARQAKSRARLNRYEQMLSESKGQRYEVGQIVIPPGPRLGDVVIEARGLGKSYGDRVLFEDLSFAIPPGAVVGIIGPNGTGKSTLFRILTGEEQPDNGAIKLGQTVKLGYVSQSRPLNPEESVYEAISEGQDYFQYGASEVNVRTYIASFNFRGTTQEKKCKYLSGGERNRVHIAKMLKSGANVLLLDEPTNDLDVEVMRNLEESLQSFPGCVLVISHDRYFLDRLATHIIAFEDDSRVVFYDGNFTSYEEDRKQRLGAEFKPHRPKFKRLQHI